MMDKTILKLKELSKSWQKSIDFYANQSRYPRDPRGSGIYQQQIESMSVCKKDLDLLISCIEIDQSKDNDIVTILKEIRDNNKPVTLNRIRLG